jgi:hypothetical protein
VIRVPGGDVDFNRRAVATLGAVFVFLFIIQGVIILSRSPATDLVTHVRIHPMGSNGCQSASCGPTSTRRYLVTFVDDEPGDSSRPVCNVTIARGSTVGYRAEIVPAGERSPGLWLGSAGIENKAGLSTHTVTVRCN